MAAILGHLAVLFLHGLNPKLRDFVAKKARMVEGEAGEWGEKICEADDVLSTAISA